MPEAHRLLAEKRHVISSGLWQDSLDVGSKDPTSSTTFEESRITQHERLRVPIEGQMKEVAE